MKRAFVTGGSGFIGQRLIRILTHRGVEVTGLGRSEKARAAIAAAGATPAAGDLDDAAALERALRFHDTVFHLAAVTDLGTPRKEFFRVNVEGTRLLAQAARRAGIGRFVHTSTEALLVGRGALVRVDETYRRLPHPPGLYPLTKALAEDVINEEARQGLHACIVRPRFVWGAGDTTLLPRMITAMRSGKWAWIGGGTELTSTCHVANCCEGLILAAEQGKRGETYFVTDGDVVAYRPFLSAVAATQGVTAPDKSVPLWLAWTAGTVAEGVWKALFLKGEPPLHRTAVRLIGYEMTIDDGKARRELGYRGEMTREMGLREMRASAAAA